jgi:hypothetical protein
MSEPESEQTPDLAAQLFGPKAEPEPRSEAKAEADEAATAPKPTEVEGAAQKPANPPVDPAQAHNALLSYLFRGGARREADERFLQSLHPPTSKESKEDGE